MRMEFTQMLLWIIFAVLTAAVLLALLWPLSRASDDEAGRRAAFDAEIYKDQLAEIDQDEGRGLISAAEAESARNEISRRLLETAREAEPETGDESATAPARGAPNPLFYATALAVPALSIGLYLMVGTPGLPGYPFAERAERAAKANQSGGPSGAMSGRKVETLIAKVEDILRKNPTDGRGWAVIAPVYLRQGRYDDSVDAFRRALALNKPSAKLLSGYGEALRLAGEGVVSEDARKAYTQALAMDPSLVVPKIALALARAQDGQFVLAAADLRKLLASSDKNAPWRPMVQEQIASFETRAAQMRQRVADAASGQKSLPRGSQAGFQAQRKAPGGPSADDVKAAQSMSAEDRSAMINQMVDGLAEKLKDDGRNLPGWLRLIQSYKVLNRDKDAAKALRSARNTFKDDKASLEKLDALAKSLGLGA